MIEQSGNAQFIFLHNHAGLLTSVILGDYEGAERWNELATRYLATGGNIHFSLADQYLFSSLLLTHKLETCSEGERAALLQAVTDGEQKLEKLAKNCPANFAHKHHLLRAEIARVEGAPQEVVVDEYSLAIASAGDDFVHLRALSSERFADYWASKKQPRIARLFLEEAFYLYERWGAAAKLRQLSRNHPDVFTSPAALAVGLGSGDNVRKTGLLQAGSLDVESIIKATRAISSEVKVDRLLARLMATIIENAGAERGSLILPDATGELYVGEEIDVEIAIEALPAPAEEV